MKKLLALPLLLTIMTTACSTIPTLPDTSRGPVLKTGDRVAFLGDSITQGGWENPHGYIRLACAALENVGVKIEPIPAGVNGDTSTKMLARLERDVIEKKPDWMFLSCGVNDVPNRIDNPGVPLPQYKKQINEILDRCAAENIRVVIMSATMLFEDTCDILNDDMIAYNDFLRATAAKRGLLLADCNAAHRAALENVRGDRTTRVLTRDGVHMNDRGNEMMASTILRAIGFGAEELEKVKTNVWPEMK